MHTKKSGRQGRRLGRQARGASAQEECEEDRDDDGKEPPFEDRIPDAQPEENRKHGRIGRMRAGHDRVCESPLLHGVRPRGPDLLRVEVDIGKDGRDEEDRQKQDRDPVPRREAGKSRSGDAFPSPQRHREKTRDAEHENRNELEEPVRGERDRVVTKAKRGHVREAGDGEGFEGEPGNRPERRDGEETQDQEQGRAASREPAVREQVRKFEHLFEEIDDFE